MKVFIDLGAYQGDTLDKAINIFRDADRFYAFEAFEPSFRELCCKFGQNDKVILIQKAASDKNSIIRLFLDASGDQGHSLYSSKNNVSSSFVEVVSLDFSRFIIDNFSKSDEIILKVNIEGAEYDLFDKMIRDGSINYLGRIFCEWHNLKIKEIEEKHNRIVPALQIAGFNLTGENQYDSFDAYASVYF